MEKEKIDRINFLARKAKETELSDAEKEEQAALRAEYIAAYRESLRGQLDSMVIQTPDGKKRPLGKKTPLQ